eukprot:TRINITY_DN416_c0_g1_i2.p1 TRINITY_DN416_c0_g1~~TRINITY_DN416_c0_g1_i2.p1  ORF type:complete len:427 (-),score=77.94 TRINITY_DN416_c0_g1_i2:57-1160(-)
MADAIVSSGLRDAGYTYVNIDDCWQIDRDNVTQQIVPDPTRFPSGMKAVADYLHSQGLKFGVYSDAGTKTCAGRPGSLTFEKIDAETYASWGVDYLKYDNCFNYDLASPQARYEAMRDALNATGREIYFSMCNWGNGNVWRWGADTGNSWRTTDDIFSNWLSVMRNLDESAHLSRFAGPGGWNDLDMLEVGVTGMTYEQEYRSHFAIWAIVKSPLILGLDVRNISAVDLDLLTSTEVIAINQDPLGVAGDVVWNEGSNMILAAPLSDGSRAVVMLNRHTHQDSIVEQYNQSFDEMDLDFSTIGYSETTEAVVRDLFAKKDLGTFVGKFSTKILWHDVAALKVTPVSDQDRDIVWRPWFPNTPVSAQK